MIPEGEYEGADGKGKPPSQEKAFIFNLMLIVLLVFGLGAFSLDAWLLGNLLSNHSNQRPPTARASSSGTAIAIVCCFYFSNYIQVIKF